MFKIGFSNDKYVELQSQHIRERVDKFGGKLYLEFGGKLFDDFHASRVLPGFQPDSKVRMLLEMKDRRISSSNNCRMGKLYPFVHAIDWCQKQHTSKKK